ncbi:CRISPR-associated protein, Csn1 family [Porphyromonas somerae]|uniref:CRISPR-associated endonuclease Cas9 n=2 Tax=Porphyromonas somerae TaxID=322095 RepID=A0A134B453_9PORP|nr:CRISPR-associated protein, Csn1 family [Porphyromonadaceae bacterium KA00676]KXB74715.1 CRISPR-associated protein, Csn1 family [Porphyromonas somerae]
MLMSKHVLGLDLGVGSIGWCLIALDAQGDPAEILGMGSRVVPLNNATDAADFSIGKAFTASQERTARRTMRRGFARYQLRRYRLRRELEKVGMLPDAALIQLPLLELWELRERAATAGECLTLPELGRVLCHINQKRGYRHVKSDAAAIVGDEGEKKKDSNSAYLAGIRANDEKLQDEHKTVGQYFAEQLRQNQSESPTGGISYRIKDQIFSRQRYIDEYDQIMAAQRVYYPDILTDEFIQMLRDEVIFMQRPLKSCKHLVSLCEFEKQEKVMRVQQDDGKGGRQLVERKVKFGPKVAPKSSPLFQLCRIYEAVNNIRLTRPDGSPRDITPEERAKIVAHLQSSASLSFAALKKLLKEKVLIADQLTSKSGLKGNSTRVALAAALQPYPQYLHLLDMELETRMMTVQLTDEETGEVTEREVAVVTDSYARQPLYRLWHILYSIEERDAMRRALITQLGMKAEDLDGGLLDQLYRLDFVKPGYGNKSAKFICKLLPQLQQGLGYSEACAAVGYRHSNSPTSEEITERTLLEKIPLLQRNELRQPLVEKILNQMINLVNALKAEYGVDEVRVELARELKMSREERERMTRQNGERKKANDKVAEKIQKCGLFPTKSRIRKYRLWEEAGRQCLYCGRSIGEKQCLNGDDMEVEHIIPKSVLYDDSYGNKTCACRRCNKEKGNRTALEYIRAKGWEAEYMERINGLLDKKTISYSKHQRLRWLKEDIPSDFLERQLRLTQYISRQAMAILQQGIRRVSASEGGVTARLRSLWGYDDILHTLNLDRYDSMGETERVSREGETTEKLRIKDWSKRKDHRHHAIDALVVASTRQGYIQRLNRVSSESEREAMSGEIEVQKATKTDKLSLLERWLTQRPHLSVRAVSDKVAEILISYRPGKRVVTRGRNIYRKKTADGREVTCVQRGVLVPRGELMEASLYGKILSQGRERIVKRYSLHALKGEVVDPRLRELITTYNQELKSREKGAPIPPLCLDKDKRQEVRSVRCYVDKPSVSSAIPIRFDERGTAITFVQSGNNHHLAVYRTPQGVLEESIVSFWDAVDRARYGIPLVITHPREVMEQVLQRGDIPESVLKSLPPSDWMFVESLQQDEMVAIGLSDEELQSAIEAQDYRKLSEHLYRVQSLSSKYYVFRYHLETSVKDRKNTSGRIPKFHRVRNLPDYEKRNVRKVRVDLLGRISLL